MVRREKRRQTMDINPKSILFRDLREGVANVMSRYGPEYWRKLDEVSAYPEAFVKEMMEYGYLAALIPEAYGGSGLGIAEASVILEEINHLGGNAGVCHAQMYIMGTLLRHGSEDQKRRYLPDIAKGKLRFQAFGVTEPDAGSDTLSIKTFARKAGKGYIVNGQKIWTSRVAHSDLMLLIARTTPKEEARKRTEGLSAFLVDLRASIGKGVTIQPIPTMMNHHSAQVFLEDLVIPEENRLGEEGRGFSYLLDGLNAERILIAAECIGDAYWFLEKASAYASSREVFGRPIGQNQGVQFPIARGYASTRAADLMRYEAAVLFDKGEPCGPEANMAKLLAADASFEAGNVAIQTFGGFGFAKEYDIERKFRETRLYQVAPISTNLILAYLGQHVLGMPRSY
jgi:acyl-CoA dehydrogenase